MKKTVLSILFITAFSTGVFAQKKAINEEVKATIDLINVKEDKVLVTVLAPEFGKSEVIYQIPKTVPGTYSTDDYGKYHSGLSRGGAQSKSHSHSPKWDVCRSANGSSHEQYQRR